MNDIQREDLRIIKEHSDLTTKDISIVLDKFIYPDKKAWKQFLRILFLSLGIGFTVSGIIFFFAYNWADLPKFVKIGIVEALLIVSVGLALFLKTNLLTRQIILTGAGALVGVLFAVFGQIYQTGANAFDFFLAWSVFTTLWVVVSNFSPMWVLYIALINTTLILYYQQVAKDWSGVLVLTLLFLLQTTIMVGIHGISFWKKSVRIPDWFSTLIALSCVVYATIGIVIGVFSDYTVSFPVLITITSVAYVVGIVYGLQNKKRFYLSAIPFSIIIILSSLLIELSDEGSMFLLVSLFITLSVSGVVFMLIRLQRKWSDEKK